ncbi:enolase C-terminal domain-like protein [Paraburkholderia sp. GAS41]|uniref:enolase C-terminal domain-like protein n=1 Tax=Paraburkholderia sp. GAS41 TaxID=3035134 RepID=UPI003D1AC63C
MHLLAATPTAHWLGYVSWADNILQEPLVVSDGYIAPPNRPGLGLAWSEENVRRFRVD